LPGISPATGSRPDRSAAAEDEHIMDFLLNRVTDLDAICS